MTNATLLVIATTLSGMIVFMKNDENTRRAATHAAMTINIGHLASHVDAYDSPGHFLTARPLREGAERRRAGVRSCKRPTAADAGFAGLGRCGRIETETDRSHHARRSRAAFDR